MSECSLRNRRTSTSTHILSVHTCLYAKHLAGDILEIPLAINVVAVYVGPPNAAAGLCGALAYALIYEGSHALVTAGVAIAITFAVRLAGPVLHLQVPQPRRRAH